MSKTNAKQAADPETATRNTNQETRNEKRETRNFLLKRREWVTAYAPLVIWIGVIFYLSTGAGSMSQTSRFIRPILEFLFPDAPESTLLIYHGYIRKFAHFAEYAVLALLASRAFFYSSGVIVKKYWHLSVLGLVLLIAFLDEAIQSFNPTRTGSGWDVLLDIAGGITMIFLFSLFTRERQHSIES